MLPSLGDSFCPVNLNSDEASCSCSGSWRVTSISAVQMTICLERILFPPEWPWSDPWTTPLCADENLTCAGSGGRTTLQPCRGSAWGTGCCALTATRAVRRYSRVFSHEPRDHLGWKFCPGTECSCTSPKVKRRKIIRILTQINNYWGRIKLSALQRKCLKRTIQDKNLCFGIMDLRILIRKKYLDTKKTATGLYEPPSTSGMCGTQVGFCQQVHTTYRY
jgi:hypothetical protein